MQEMRIACGKWGIFSNSLHFIGKLSSHSTSSNALWTAFAFIKHYETLDNWTTSAVNSIRTIFFLLGNTHTHTHQRHESEKKRHTLLTEFSLLSELSIVSIALICSSSDIFAIKKWFNWWNSINQPNSMRKIAKLFGSVRLCCDFPCRLCVCLTEQLRWKERPVKQYDACRCNFIPQTHKCSMWTHHFAARSICSWKPLVAAKYKMHFTLHSIKWLYFQNFYGDLVYKKFWNSEQFFYLFNLLHFSVKNYFLNLLFWIKLLDSAQSFIDPLNWIYVIPAKWQLFSTKHTNSQFHRVSICIKHCSRLLCGTKRSWIVFFCYALTQQLLGFKDIYFEMEQ